MTDFTDPDHCLNTASGCLSDVMTFGYRIRRDLDLEVEFDGWFDPEPDSFIVEASGNQINNIYRLRYVMRCTK